MVSRPLAPRWSPIGMGQRLTRNIRQPGDLALFAELGYFIWRVPEWLDEMPLPKLLEKIQSLPRSSSSDWSASVERINRLSRFVFRLPWFRARSTCYTRALIFYRFLDAPHERVSIHFVIEPARAKGGRLRGHAWVTIGSTLIDPPPPDIVARTRSIYSYPPTAQKSAEH